MSKGLFYTLTTLLLISFANGRMWARHGGMDMGEPIGPNRTIGMVVFEAFEVLDVFGPLEFWNSLSQMNYNLNLVLIANQSGPVSSKIPPHFMGDGMYMNTSLGFGQTIYADHSFEDAPKIDILIVPGGFGVDLLSFRNDKSVANFIAKTYPTVEYVYSVCTGAGLLADSGILDGRNATTSKYAYDGTIFNFTKVNWMKQARFVVDGNVMTSSGVSAGMDLTYHFISKLYGAEVANQVANKIEYTPHTNSSWDPFFNVYLDGGNDSVLVDPCPKCAELIVKNSTDSIKNATCTAMELTSSSASSLVIAFTFAVALLVSSF